MTEMAVKFVEDGIIEGLAIPFGGPFAGKDFDGEYFAADTDFCLEWFGEAGRPILYDHGTNGNVKTSVVGRQTSLEVRDDGVWIKAELDKNSRYRKVVDELIAANALSFSSGAMPHLVERTKSGKITRWPWVEESLTPTPANPNALVYSVKATDAIEHLEAVDTAIPQPLAEALKKLDEWADNRDRDAGLGTGSLDDQAGRVTAAVVEFRDHAAASAQMRTKAGRVLSSANRQRIEKVLSSKQAVIDAYSDLEALLAETDPEAEKALGLALIEAEQTLARALGVPIAN